MCPIAEGIKKSRTLIGDYGENKESLLCSKGSVVSKGVRVVSAPTTSMLMEA